MHLYLLSFRASAALKILNLYIFNNNKYSMDDKLSYLMMTFCCKTNLTKAQGYIYHRTWNYLLEQMIKDSFLQQDFYLSLQIICLEHFLTVGVVWLKSVKQILQFLHSCCCQFQEEYRLLSILRRETQVVSSKIGEGMLMEAELLQRQQHHTFRHLQMLYYYLCICL